MNTIESMPFAALSLLPIIFALFWMALMLGMFVFVIIIIIRFVRAHERIAKNLEAIALRLPIEPKEKAPPIPPAAQPPTVANIPSAPSDFSPPR